MPSETEIEEQLRQIDDELLNAWFVNDNEQYYELLEERTRLKFAQDNGFLLSR